MMREAIGAGALVMCGVECGVRLDHSFHHKPEHYILAVSYDTINSQDAFLFWDPDSAVSN
jgi:hypothetical protein